MRTPPASRQISALDADGHQMYYSSIASITDASFADMHFIAEFRLPDADDYSIASQEARRFWRQDDLHADDAAYIRLIGGMAKPRPLARHSLFAFADAAFATQPKRKLPGGFMPSAKIFDGRARA